MAELLAKPDQSLLEHTLQVLHLGKLLAGRLDLPEDLKLKALMACALHDVGKATELFQDYISAGGSSRGQRPVYPHALASLPAVLLAERVVGKRLGWEEGSLHATAAVISHHSPLGPQVYRDFGKVSYHQQAREVLRQLWEALREDYSRLPPFEEVFSGWEELNQQPLGDMLDSTSLSLPGGRRVSLRGILREQDASKFAQVKTVLHLADWLASAGETDIEGLFLQRGRQRVVEAMNRPTVVQWKVFQQRCAETRGEVLHLRAPTGTGKTEALLLWAGDADRLIYLLPTQATVNAMWRRLQRIYGEEKVGLAHGRASYLLRKEAPPDEEPLDLRLFSSVFAKPVTVATLDQYLLAHLNGRHWEERRTLTRRAVVVLDEIHTYEPYTLGMLAEALSREHPLRLALASATLPSSVLNLFPTGELVEAEAELWNRRRHSLTLREGSLQEGIADAVEHARQGKRVLVVANTVAQAQRIYQQLKQLDGWEALHLLHAHFIFRHRQEKEEQVQSARPGTIFVATQVVEVSLDIDYDILLTEVAPLDALVQRMGRVNRKGERPPVPVQVFTTWEPGAERVYGKEVLQTSLCLLKSLSEQPTDRDLFDAVEMLYGEVTNSPAWQEEWKEGERTLEELREILGCYTIDLSDEEMRQRFTARRGVVSIEVIPQQFVQEAYAMRQAGEGWKMVELLLPVPIYWLKRFPEMFTPSTDLGAYIAHSEYNESVGLLPQLPSGEAWVG